jgi:predicted branched-subunit amino acid permease
MSLFKIKVGKNFKNGTVKGIKAAIPIAIGYIPIAIAFGVISVQSGISVIQATCQC